MNHTEIEQLQEIIKKCCGHNVVHEYPITHGPIEFSVTALLFWSMIINELPKLAKYRPRFKYNPWHIFPKVTIDDNSQPQLVSFECCYIPHPAVLIVGFEFEAKKQKFVAENSSTFNYLVKLCDESINRSYNDLPEDVLSSKKEKIFQLLDVTIGSSVAKKIISSSPDIKELQHFINNGFDYSLITGIDDDFVVKCIIADNIFRPAEFWLKNGVPTKIVNQVYEAGNFCDLYVDHPTIKNAQTVITKMLSLADNITPTHTSSAPGGGIYG
jgi:hypothetical protein